MRVSGSYQSDSTREVCGTSGFNSRSDVVTHAIAEHYAAALEATEEEAAQMKDVQSEAWVPADSMAFDKVVSPADLRNEIIQVLLRN